MKINSLNTLESLTPKNNVMLTLERYNYNNCCSLGVLFHYDNGEYTHICYTLEPSPNATFPCLDCGDYVIHFRSKSPKFSRRFPYKALNDGNVPLILSIGEHKRDGIRIHCGNYPQDTKGCILLGEGVEGVTLTRSISAYKDFMEKFSKFDKVYLKITDVLQTADLT